MGRNFSSTAIILQSRPLGEKNIICTLFSSSHGLVDAVAYGAAGNNSLRVAAAPLCTGTAYLYRHKETAMSKLTDFAVETMHRDIVSDLGRFMHASLWSELILVTYGSGGEHAVGYRLFAAALSALEQCTASQHIYLASVRFIWKYLHLNGIAPDIYHCSRCRRELSGGEANCIDTDAYHLICPQCNTAHPPSANEYPGGEARVPFPAVLYHFLTDGLALPFADLIHNTALLAELGTLWEYLVAATRHSIEQPLKSLYVLQATTPSERG